ncbi:M23 family metallopeptidase [Demequina mangrovi]|uniref:Peptidase family M23 n=1 Tax=Demequina mangrovi TaxID=1043493 RepID=A0A1H6Z985_9MICO|nr:M23 family metallopeptidase [Demequina mangrovi]SEJ49296.1 Peptidase family M23 [Demequina mangrovi]
MGSRAAIATLVMAWTLLGGLTAEGSPGAMIAPLEPMRAVRLFAAPAQPWAAGHRGIDLRAAVGDPVRAPAGGVVMFAGPVVDRVVVTVDHGDGTVSSFEPVADPPAVGTAVSRGDPVGTVASVAGHCAPQVCLHWGVRVDGRYADPLDLLEGFGPVVLLPAP